MATDESKAGLGARISRNGTKRSNNAAKTENTHSSYNGFDNTMQEPIQEYSISRSRTASVQAQDEYDPFSSVSAPPVFTIPSDNEPDVFNTMSSNKMQTPHHERTGIAQTEDMFDPFAAQLEQKNAAVGDIHSSSFAQPSNIDMQTSNVPFSNKVPPRQGTRAGNDNVAANSKPHGLPFTGDDVKQNATDAAKNVGTVITNAINHVRQHGIAASFRHFVLFFSSARKPLLIVSIIVLLIGLLFNRYVSALYAVVLVAFGMYAAKLDEESDPFFMYICALCTAIIPFIVV